MKILFKPVAAALAIALLMLPIGLPGQSTSAGDAEQRAEYLDLPPRPQAECALYKLDMLIEQMRGKGAAETLQKLAEGRRWLVTVLDKYASYSFTNPISPSDKPAEVRAGKGGPAVSPRTDGAASPLGMLQHGWRALEGLRQLQATRNLSSAPPGVSASELKMREQALNEAADAMQKAVEALEAARGWVEHGDGMFVSMKTPAGFIPGKNPKFRMCFDGRSPGSGESGKAVYVSVERNPQGLAAYDHQRNAVDREKKILPDLAVAESGRFYPGLRGIWFAYGGTWEGKKISGLIYHQADPNFVLEVKYVALSRLFDEEECEGIIRSVRER